MILVNMGAVTAIFVLRADLTGPSILKHDVFSILANHNLSETWQFSQSVGTYKRCKQYQQNVAS